jgi:nicotinamide-nucleotide amidase
MIFNHHGTAAGIDAIYVSGDQKTICRVFVMPGVPKEMKAMFTRDVLPHIKQASGGAVILSRTLHTFGLGESAVAERIGTQMMRDRNPSVGTTVTGGVVSLRINARFGSPEEATRRLQETEDACRAALGDVIYGQDDETLQEVVGRMLKAAGKTVTTAESCTGGLLAKMLTDVPGSSAYFNQGWVTYSNEAKESLLYVKARALKDFGAVSKDVVEEMAENALVRAKADFALSISGIAGPDGGTPEKPVGTVWIALARRPDQTRYPRAESETAGRQFLFPGDREMIRDRSAKMALTMLRFHLLGKPMPF